MRDELIKLITVKGEKRSSRGFSEGEDIEETEVFASVLSVTEMCIRDRSKTLSESSAGGWRR